MRRTTSLAGLLALAVTMLACNRSPQPPKDSPATSRATSGAAPSPAPATAPESATSPQPGTAAHDTAAFDQTVADNVGDPAKLREILSTLQQAVRKHDAAAVAAIVNYPITINPNTPGALSIRTPQTFAARYDQIITPHIAEVIEKQKYEDLFVNYQGAMLGDGEVWIAGICKDNACKQSDIRIRTIQNASGNSK